MPRSATKLDHWFAADKDHQAGAYLLRCHRDQPSRHFKFCPLKDDFSTETYIMSINKITLPLDIPSLPMGHLQVGSPDLQFYHDSKLNHETVREDLLANRATHRLLSYGLNCFC
jgi:hypothetical protein